MAFIGNGNVLQVVESFTTAITSYQNTDARIIAVTITPKGPNSKLKIDFNCATNTSDDSDAANGESNPYCGFRIRRSVNGGSFVNADYVGTNRTPSHLDASPLRADDQVNYNQGARYRMTHKKNTIIDAPSYTLGNSIVYELQVHRRGDGYMGWIQVGAPHGFGTDNDYLNYPYGLVITEIAQ